MQYGAAIDTICALPWDGLRREDLANASQAYYYFSIQFRENLLLAQQAHPHDIALGHLVAGECDTDNLSPYPAVALPGERMNHDEFMRRLLGLPPFSEDRRIDAAGERYLAEIRALDPVARIMSIASYEDGGLERVFTAMLTAPDWQGESLAAFRHFLAEHIRFDSDPDGGHGALSRHIAVDARVAPLWLAFLDLLTGSVPAFAALQSAEIAG